jgi:hypothetical protein
MTGGTGAFGFMGCGSKRVHFASDYRDYIESAGNTLHGDIQLWQMFVKGPHQEVEGFWLLTTTCFGR